MGSNGRDRLRKRMTWLYFALVGVGVACLLKILYLSIFEMAVASGTSDKCVDTTEPGWESLVRDDTYCYVRENTLRPVRGEIFDDHGRVLVANYTVFEVAFDGKGFAKEYKDTLSKNPEAFKELLRALADDFQSQFQNRYPKLTSDYYYDFFVKNIKNKRYATIFPVNDRDDRKWIVGIDTSFIKNRPYLYKKVYSKKTGDSVRVRAFRTHLNFVPSNVRVNPYGEMARRTLGIYSNDVKYGLESSMNEVLAGIDGSKKYLELNHAKVPLRDRLDPVDGYNIHTTIKLEIQHAVHNELSKKLTELNAEWGCAIVMETKTGEIKAISNLRRTPGSQSYYTESMEYALNAKVEPGSTFKLASLLAYLEKNLNDTAKSYPMFNHTFEFKTKSGSVKRYPKSDSKIHGETYGKPSEIFQRSSNIGIAEMIFTTYGRRGFASYRDQLRKMGLLDTIHTQLGDLMPARIKDGTNDFNTYYSTCFGAGFTIPILKTLVYYNAVANDGRMMAPLFVRYVTNNYDTVRSFDPVVLNEQFVSDTTVKRARKYLEQVVWGPYGTARRYRNPKCMFAGKTGTRDIWDAQSKSYRKDINSVSFCGYFPMDKPQYTIIIYIYGVPHHSDVAVDAFSRIASSIMNSSNYSATRSVDDLPLLKMGRSGPINKGTFNKLVSGMGYDTVTYDTDDDYIRIDFGDTNRMLSVRAVPHSEYQKMPDVHGMTAADAVAEMAKAGFRVRVIGRGYVKKQVYDDNARFVKLYLEPL